MGLRVHFPNTTDGAKPKRLLKPQYVSITIRSPVTVLLVANRKCRFVTIRVAPATTGRW